MCLLFVTFNSCDKEENVVEPITEISQTALQESQVFKTFMEYHVSWYLKYAFSTIGATNKETEKFAALKASFDPNDMPNLDSEIMQDFIAYFDFQDKTKFIEFYNSYSKARAILYAKFPNIETVNNEFVNAQKHYLENFEAKNLFQNQINGRNDDPEAIFTTIEMPKCYWSAEYVQINLDEPNCLGVVPILELVETNEDNPDFSNCPGFIANNCQATYNSCVVEKQLQIIDDLVSCFGEEYIYYEAGELAKNECYWSITGEYVCSGNDPGVGGVEILNSLLEGLNSSQLNENEIALCFECLVNDHFCSVCLSCRSFTLNFSNCCD